jgi:hypothetical protein
MPNDGEDNSSEEGVTLPQIIRCNRPIACIPGTPSAVQGCTLIQASLSDHQIQDFMMVGDPAAACCFATVKAGRAFDNSPMTSKRKGA